MSSGGALFMLGGGADGRSVGGRFMLARQVESHACSKFAQSDTICISLMVASDSEHFVGDKRLVVDE